MVIFGVLLIIELVMGVMVVLEEYRKCVMW